MQPKILDSHNPSDCPAAVRARPATNHRLNMFKWLCILTCNDSSLIIRSFMLFLQNILLFTKVCIDWKVNVQSDRLMYKRQHAHASVWIVDDCLTRGRLHIHLYTNMPLKGIWWARKQSFFKFQFPNKCFCEFVNSSDAARSVCRFLTWSHLAQQIHTFALPVLLLIVFANDGRVRVAYGLH